VLGAIGLHGQSTGTLSPSPYLTIVDANGATISGACVWTYIAGTSSQATTYTDKALAVPNTNPVVANSSGQMTLFLVPGVSYKYIVEGPCTPPAHGTVIRTQDNIDPTPASAAAIDQTGIAAEAITAGQVCYLSDGEGGQIAGRWYIADASFSFEREGQLIGIALGSNLVPPATLSFRIAGLVTNLSGLVVGANYYVGTAGALSADHLTTNNARFVGQAISSTSLMMAANPPAPNVRLVSKTTTPVVVVNTVSAVDIFKPTVPGGTLGDNRILRLTINGTYTNTSGGNSTLALAVVYGSSPLVTGTVVNYATATTGAVRLAMDINADAFNQQRAVGVLTVPVSGTTNAGTVWNAHSTMATYGTGTDDSSMAKTLLITVTHGVANANIGFTMNSAMLEVIGQLQ